jgi:hypothetical protein
MNSTLNVNVDAQYKEYLTKRVTLDQSNIKLGSLNIQPLSFKILDQPSNYFLKSF